MRKLEKKTSINATIEVDTTQLDEAIKKTDRLVELLKEANELMCSLDKGSKSDFEGKVVRS